MAFDASVLRCLTIELNEKLLNAKIDKIHQPQKDELFLAIRSKTGNFKLIISVNPSCSRIHLTEEKQENPAQPPMFCMLLRKHLGGGKIVKIEQSGFERIIVFYIESYDELGDLSIKKLIVEIMGKHSNIILTDKEDKIIDSIKRIDISTSSVRQVLPALTYIMPPNDRIDPLTFEGEMPDLDKRNPEKALCSVFSGISPQLAGEILRKGFKDVVNRIKNNEFHPCIYYEKGKPLDFSALSLIIYPAEVEKKENASISAVIDEFYRKKAHAVLLNRLSSELIRLISNNIDRCEKKLGIFARQIQDAEKREKYRIYGELLTSNLYKVKYGDSEVLVDNYYTGEQVKITLDPTLSPAKNAQKYYTRYNKAKVSEEQALIQQKKTQKELDYLESVADEILRAESPAEIAEIKEELRDTGYIARDLSSKKRKEAGSSKPLQFEIEGYSVFVGRNNRQNDFLTLKTARSVDTWLHTKNIPGSHVIIKKKEGEEIPDSVIVKAASIAAFHSKAKNSSKVPVDYTLVKNVKKPSGAKPGMVIYEHYNTVLVEPSES